MLSDEEKKAIEYFKNEIKGFETVITDMEKEIDDKNWLRKNILEIKEDISVRNIVLNLIEKQSKEIEDLKLKIGDEKVFIQLGECIGEKKAKDKIKAKMEEIDKILERNLLVDSLRDYFETQKEVLESLLEKE